MVINGKKRKRKRKDKREGNEKIKGGEEREKENEWGSTSPCSPVVLFFVLKI